MYDINIQYIEDILIHGYQAKMGTEIGTGGG